MKAFMFAALDSESCLRRSKSMVNFNPNTYCDPLGDRNIHWSLKPINNNTKSVVLVTARLDANSLFDKLVPGAASTITGLVTLLTTASYLKNLNPTVTGKLNH